VKSSPISDTSTTTSSDSPSDAATSARNVRVVRDHADVPGRHARHEQAAGGQRRDAMTGRLQRAGQALVVL
jgi:hypothetical protein